MVRNATLRVLAFSSTLPVSAVSVVAVAASPVTGARVTTQQLPIRRVVLYSSGVAFVERRGLVTGNADVVVAFEPSQLDDVLESLLVLDLGKGNIGGVSYETTQSLGARLGPIPLRVPSLSREESGVGGLAEVLRQLQGASVAVQTASRTIAGEILTIEARESWARQGVTGSGEPDEAGGGGRMTRTFLVLFSEEGSLISFDLAEVRAVRVLDRDTRLDLRELARTTSAVRRRDAKTIVVSARGQGTREVVVSYTVAAPVWKTTYRVVLDAAGRPFFQGWAIVDNVGQEDWRNVRLSLVSGSPFSFVPRLQLPLYRHRPVEQLAYDLSTTPQFLRPWRDEPVDSWSPAMSVMGGAGIPGGSVGGVPGGTLPTLAPLRPGEPSDVPTTTISDLVTSGAGVRTAARAVSVGDLFDYRMKAPVSVARDHSALLPILQERLEGEQVSLWLPSCEDRRPLAALRLRNTSTLTLDAGPITVLDGDVYAGEASLERIRPGEEQMVSYAVDLATLVETHTERKRGPAFFLRVGDGSLEAHYYDLRTTVYTLTNQSEQPRILYLEQRRESPWQIAPGGPQPVEARDAVWRFRVELPPKKQVELPVTERMGLQDRYSLDAFSHGNLATLEERGFLDDASRAPLERILALRSRLAELAARATAAESETSALTADQRRLGANIQSASGTREGRALVRRWLALAAADESRLSALAAEAEASKLERAQLEAELEKTVGELAFERRL